MLQSSETKWSPMEETIAQQALQKAYERETTALIEHIRDRANSINQLEDLWYLHDLLSTKRHEIDGKYHYDQTTIVFDFAKLVKEKWLSIEELTGLKPQIITKISVLARM
ncbi:hypothetical protein NIES4102_21130 [Chondrocystis sp. NIES-4102]|nr:hypothetical protein NIES4102_21130 [Chondrocystis sp. NIES-4102]